MKMICIIIGEKKQCGRLWKLVGKDKSGNVIFDETYCCSSPAIKKEAREVVKGDSDIDSLEIREIQAEGTLCSVIGRDAIEESE